jgi:hypothetical protein
MCAPADVCTPNVPERVILIGPVSVAVRPAPCANKAQWIANRMNEQRGKDVLDWLFKPVFRWMHGNTWEKSGAVRHWNERANDGSGSIRRWEALVRGDGKVLSEPELSDRDGIGLDEDFKATPPPAPNAVAGNQYWPLARRVTISGSRFLRGVCAEGYLFGPKCLQPAAPDPTVSAAAVAADQFEAAKFSKTD